MPRKTAFTGPAQTLEGSNALTVRSSVWVIAAVDAPDHLKAQADWVCDGVADEEEIWDAIRSLPTIGGKIKFTIGTFTLSTNGSLPTGTSNIILEGSGKGTLFNCNGVLAIFIQGSSPSAIFREFSTDAGGVTINPGLEGRAEYWKAGVWTSSVSTIIVPQVKMKWLDHSDLLDIDMGYLPARSVVTEVRVYVEEAFNDAVTNLLSVGGMWGAGVELDAYTLDVDVSTIGEKVLLAGARFGTTSIVSNLSWITYSGAAPAAGRALVTVFFEVAPVRP